MIYLASPYSHPDPNVRRERFNAACEFSAKIMHGGDHVFSPIAHTHPIVEAGKKTGHDLPGEWQFWKDYDHEFIEMCAEVVVLMLPGWKISKGVCAEIDIANELGIPVKFYIPHYMPDLPWDDGTSILNYKGTL